MSATDRRSLFTFKRQIAPLLACLLAAPSLLVACSAPGAPTSTLEPLPTVAASAIVVVETPQSTVTAAPTDRPTQTPQIQATPTPATREDPLAGTHWTLVSLGPPGEEQPVLPGSAITLQFENTGEAGGSAGCNSYGADYQVQGVTLTFGPMARTAQACVDEDLMDQEQRYFEALQSAGPFMLADGSLTLFFDEGQGRLDFVAREAQPEPDGGPAEAQNVTIGAMTMVNATDGWAIGRSGEATVDQVLLTNDGGGRWQVLTPQEATASATERSPDLSAAAYFASARQAWVAYARPQPAVENAPPRVWLTADGGQSWRPSMPLDLGDLPFEFFGPSHLGSTDGQFGWLMAHLGAGMSHDYIAIFTTRDGGQTWQRVTDPDNNPTIQACNKSGLLFTGAQEGWLAGNCPGLMPPLFLYHTTDGGASWTQTELPAPDALASGAGEGLGSRCGIPQIALLPDRRPLLALRCLDFDAENAQSWLYTTRDGGASWQMQTLPEPAGVFTFLAAGEGWYLAADESQPDTESRLYHTTDGGDSWRTLAQVEAQGQAQVTFVDAMNGWIAAGYPPERSLWRSSDGGMTWEALAPVAVTP